MRTEPRNRQQMSDAVLNSLTKATGYNVRNAGTDARNQASEWKENAKAFATQDQYKLGRRGLYGFGSAAALGTILNLSNNREEEEQYR